MKGIGEPESMIKWLNNESRNGRIILPNFHLQVAQRSFLYRGSCLWNRLPPALRSTRKIGSFKRNLKTWVMENISKFVD